MTRLIIAGEIYDIDDPVTVGEPITPAARAILTGLYITRMHARAIYFATKNPTLSRETIQEEINKMAAAFVFDDEPEPDAVEVEAILIAEELITQELAKQGLPPPKSLREHALQLASDPKIIAQARTRIRAQAQAVQRTLFQ